MKKILVAALALVMLMTACCAMSEDTVKIGGLSPLTGSVAVYGLAVQAGVDYAVEEINANGGVLGKQIEFIWRDDQGDPAYAVSMYNQLVGENIVALVGAVTTAPTIAVFNEAAKTGMPASTLLPCSARPAARSLFAMPHSRSTRIPATPRPPSGKMLSTTPSSRSNSSGSGMC